MKVGNSEKDKSSESSFWFSSEDGVIETSSRSGSVMTKEKSSYLDSKRKLSSQLGFVQSESSQSGDSESTQSMSSLGRSPTTHNSGSTNKSGQNPAAKTANVPSSVRSQKNIQYMSGSNKQNTQTTSTVSATSKSSGLGTLNSNNINKCLKNLKCNLISDSVAPSCSSSRSKSPSKNVMKKRSLEGDSSVSGKGRQATTTSTFGGFISSSSGGASISNEWWLRASLANHTEEVNHTWQARCDRLTPSGVGGGSNLRPLASRNTTPPLGHPQGDGKCSF
ncbi:hypothetical protein C2S53_006475 [Perilla frutescens var. hirtella]|uniref:Uncharacterized protein n=1 Tax=Perilla frutescens var. hirtella TaxID=608512 RepID=A0AAD4ITG3_PERFH|nr:hypothetical protein C2S53_006475 [Perilla frutescens var. hirtella]